MELEIPEDFPKFYKNLIIVWCKHAKCNPVTASNVYSQQIWNNGFIKLQNRKIYIKRFHKAGVCHVKDFFADNGSILEWEIFKNKFNLRHVDYFKWRQLIGSIPISWKQLINEDAGSSRDNASTEQHFLQLTRQLVIDRMSSKQIYVILIKQLKRKPKSEQTIQTLIENNDINWEKSYSLGSEITVDTFGRSFCFKLTHNILYLNKILAQMGKHDTPLCSFCG